MWDLQNKLVRSVEDFYAAWAVKGKLVKDVIQIIWVINALREDIFRLSKVCSLYAEQINIYLSNHIFCSSLVYFFFILSFAFTCKFLLNS